MYFEASENLFGAPLSEANCSVIIANKLSMLISFDTSHCQVKRDTADRVCHTQFARFQAAAKVIRFDVMKILKE